MSRICVRMDIDKGLYGKSGRSPTICNLPLLPYNLPYSCLFILLLGLGLLLTSCIPTSTPRVIKIGLIAPFEGLYRRTGYAALETVRQTIEEQQSLLGGDYLLMPVALDDLGDPQQAVRAAQKLLVDPDVQTVIGPFLPVTMAAVEDILAQRPDIGWVPFYQGGLEGAESTLVSAVADLGKLHRAERLVLAGWTPGQNGHNEQQWREVANLPVHQSDDPQEVQPTDWVLWLGSPAGAASYLNQLRTRRAEVPFWMGPTGGDPVFSDLAHTFEHVYWAIRVYGEPDERRRRESIDDPTAYVIQQITRTAIRSVRVRNSPPMLFDNDGLMTRIEFFQIEADGVSSPVDVALFLN